jgi:hypothetical protein
MILYLTAWDDDQIIKIGCSDSRRWLSFPGARLVLALPFQDSASCYGLERDLHRDASRIWDRAFDSGADARHYLGKRGSGYLECYRATVGEALHFIASQYDVTVRRHSTTSRSYERTNGRTNADAPTGEHQSCSYVTRARATRSRRAREDTP